MKIIRNNARIKHVGKSESCMVYSAGSRYGRQARALRGSMMAAMWNDTAQGFCDGICADPLVQTNASVGFGGIYTHMYVSTPNLDLSSWTHL